MKNKKLKLFWEKYQQADSNDSRLMMMREFMLGSTFDELMAWNNFLSEMSQKSLQNIVNQGLTDEDRSFFKEQFDKFDDLAAQIKGRKVA